MKTSIILCLALAAPVVACAGDQNKKLQEAQSQEAENTRKSAEQTAEQTKKTQEGAIEQQSEQAKQQAEALPEGSRERAKTQVEMSADRQKYIADAQSRMQKINAKLTETRQKAQLARGNIPTSTMDKVNEAARLSASLNDEINHMPQVSTQSWSDEKKRVDSRLDDVEKMVDDAASDVSSHMP
jgi:hypothetical protein